MKVKLVRKKLKSGATTPGWKYLKQMKVELVRKKYKSGVTTSRWKYSKPINELTELEAFRLLRDFQLGEYVLKKRLKELDSNLNLANPMRA